MDFHGTEPELLEIDPLMDLRVENTRFIEANNL